MTEHKIIIPIKPKTKTLNSNDRMHWAQKSALTKMWRQIGWARAAKTVYPKN